jgi:hypothetical protein
MTIPVQVIGPFDGVSITPQPPHAALPDSIPYYICTDKPFQLVCHQRGITYEVSSLWSEQRQHHFFCVFLREGDWAEMISPTMGTATPS